MCKARQGNLRQEVGRRLGIGGGREAGGAAEKQGKGKATSQPYNSNRGLLARTGPGERWEEEPMLWGVYRSKSRRWAVSTQGTECESAGRVGAAGQHNGADKDCSVFHSGEGRGCFPHWRKSLRVTIHLALAALPTAAFSLVTVTLKEIPGMGSEQR